MFIFIAYSDISNLCLNGLKIKTNEVLMYENNFKLAKSHILGKGERQPAKNPKLSFIFASPGAGKSSILKQNIVKEMVADSQPVVIEIDELKYFAKDAPKEERKAIIDEWYNRIIDQALETKQNIIILRSKDMVHYGRAATTLNKAKQHNYNTEVNFLAVDKRKSRLSMTLRYEKALKNMFSGNSDFTNYPRKPKFFYHYVYFKSLPLAAEKCCKDKDVDLVRVFNRDGELLAFDNKISHQKSAQSPKKAIKAERKRPWSESEKKRFSEEKDQMQAFMKDRKAPLKEKIIRNLLINKRSK